MEAWPKIFLQSVLRNLLQLIVGQNVTVGRGSELALTQGDQLIQFAKILFRLVLEDPFKLSWTLKISYHELTHSNSHCAYGLDFPELWKSFQGSSYTSIYSQMIFQWIYENKNKKCIEMYISILSVIWLVCATPVILCILLLGPNWQNIIDLVT